MKSNLKQQITSMVKEIIPLGVSRRYSADETSTTHLAPWRQSEKTEEKQVLEVVNPLPKHMLPFKSPMLEQKSVSAVASSSGSRKGSEGGQGNLSNVLMRKLQLDDNNNSNYSSKKGSLQPAAKKGILIQRQSSYNKDKEFALAFFKQLNENLKVGNAMLHSDSLHKQSPVPHPHVSKSSESYASSSAQGGGRIPGSNEEQRGQHSAEKVDKLLNGGHNSHLLSPVSSQQKESTPYQATTPAGVRSLSLKRRRESSTEEKGEGKRLCQDEGYLTPTSARASSTSAAHNISSPPKYVRSAILKTGSEEGSLLLVEHSRDKTKTSTSQSSSFPRQLFKEPSREPRSESCKSQSETQPAKISRTNHLKELMQSSESKYQVDRLHALDPSPSLSSKLIRKCSNERSSLASSHSSSLTGLIDEVTISSSPHQSGLATKTCVDLTGSWKGVMKSPKPDPDTSPRANLPSTAARLDGEEKRNTLWNNSCLDLELDDGVGLGLGSCGLNLSSSSSSSSSSSDHLLSLREILERSTRVPATPDKGAFSEPSTPLPNAAPVDVKNKVTSYKNTLEQMLKEKEQNQKSKELEMQLLQSCKEDLLKLEEDEENANAEAALSLEQKEFLQRFSVTSCAIRDLHPGEEVFTLANFGRLFSHQSLDLRKIGVKPNTLAQQTLLQAHTEHVLLLLSAGLFRRAYSASPCQPQVTRWLFQMMSVHPNPSTSSQILQAMTTIALSAAQHIVENGKTRFKVWVPSLQDVALVFLNMGVSFVNLFPLEALQPPFTEGDLLEGLDIQPDSTRTEKKCDSFPEHNFESIVKYLALCAALCPKAYTDEELLLLLTLVYRVSLETCLKLLPTGDLSCLLQHLLNNMTHWEIQLPQVCQAITDLTEDHHNLRRLVQLLPHNGRGKQLKRHLSVSIISKLLNHRCTYTPACTEFQLSDLRSYLPRMRPSSLLKGLIAAQKEQQETDSCAPTPDQQAYYLCYSLLALTNEASNFEFLPSNQRNELLLLSAELEKHIKCDIRESEKMLYRSKVKDFVARIYTRWQVLLQRSRPQEGKLYDYWTPLPEDEIPFHEENQSTEHPKQEATEDPQSEDSDSVQEEWVEEKNEVAVKSEEELEECVGETGELLEILGDTKEEEQSVNLTDKDGKEKHKVDMNEELLGEGSSEMLMESDLDEDLVNREEELLKEEDPLEKDGDLIRRENEDLEQLELSDEEWF
ncbi:SMC5-SMC6 complex localization factor protein 2 isoform X3 [Salminus brasiliensis]|uniref:SMC5-SMC6 complex localization factor protein 2 isoform X3 n=1 Tax=Salminus brasiliensis TaxID=930266 RepID=UPI003B83063F